MQKSLTAEQLINEIGTVTSRSDARAVVNRAVRVANVPTNRPLQMQELLLVCEALAAEGGLVQEIAEVLASRALDS